ncbi:hypothetical protein ACN5ZK_02200 [Macrococcoides bohemicum]
MKKEIAALIATSFFVTTVNVSAMETDYYMDYAHMDMIFTVEMIHV